MSEFWQSVLASGVLTLIMSIIVTRGFNKGFSKIDDWHKMKSDEDFLLMTKLKAQGDLVMLMAQKLHDAGTINGDLEEIKKKYQKANEDYDAHIMRLASEVLRK